MNERWYLKPLAVASVNREEDLGLNSTLKEEADTATKMRRAKQMTQEKHVLKVSERQYVKRREWSTEPNITEILTCQEWFQWDDEVIILTGEG